MDILGFAAQIDKLAKEADVKVKTTETLVAQMHAESRAKCDQMLVDTRAKQDAWASEKLLLLADTRAEQEAWAAEKLLIAETYPSNSETVRFDIGGQLFATSRATLETERANGTMLQALCSGRHAHSLEDQKNGTIFIDRDPSAFRFILNYFRSSSTFIPPNDPTICAQLVCDARYFAMPKAFFGQDANDGAYVPFAWCQKYVDEKGVPHLPASFLGVAASAATTKAAGPGLEKALPAQKASFTITACDARGALCGVGGDTFVVELYDEKRAKTEANLDDKGDGTYVASYTLPADAKGDQILSVLLRGSHIQGSPFRLPLLTKNFDPSKVFPPIQLLSPSTARLGASVSGYWAACMGGWTAQDSSSWAIKLDLVVGTSLGIGVALPGANLNPPSYGVDDKAFILGVYAGQVGFYTAGSMRAPIDAKLITGAVIDVRVDMLSDQVNFLVDGRDVGSFAIPPGKSGQLRPYVVMHDPSTQFSIV